MASSDRGESASRRQRLRIVGSSRPGAAQTSSSDGARAAVPPAPSAARWRRRCSCPRRHPRRRRASRPRPGELHERGDAADVVHRNRAPHALALLVVAAFDGDAGRHASRRRRGGTPGRRDRGRASASGGTPASRRRAKRKASVALPTPSGPVISHAWCIRPPRNASARIASGPSWPSSNGLARGSGAVIGAVVRSRPAKRNLGCDRPSVSRRDGSVRRVPAMPRGSRCSPAPTLLR